MFLPFNPGRGLIPWTLLKNIGLRAPRIQAHDSRRKRVNRGYQLIACGNNSSVGGTPLFADVVIDPARSIKLREDMFASAGSFGEGHQ